MGCAAALLTACFCWAWWGLRCGARPSPVQGAERSALRFPLRSVGTAPPTRAVREEAGPKHRSAAAFGSLLRPYRLRHLDKALALRALVLPPITEVGTEVRPEHGAGGTR